MFGIIGRSLNHFGNIGKSLIGRFGNFIGGIGKKKEHDMVSPVPDYPSAPTPGFEPGDRNAPWNKNKSMLKRGRERYGANPGYHRDPRLVNI